MKAYFAGGCFWCMEKPYHQIEGVISVTSGYSGGSEQNPSYSDVKAQKTGHRETVEIVFDENRVSFTELFGIYLNSIDPFDDGGQFIDRGHSYTCAVYCVGDGQRKIVTDIIGDIEKKFSRAVAISVENFTAFYPAEEYHLNFAEKNPDEYEKEYELSGRKAFNENKENVFPGRTT